ncbi:hypothetical protein [Ruminococcus sp.]|uniref:hypothetical protein n=1 Tax=Ruminococcus sp. TaxID=41978 RepID=UPI0025FAF2FC|nr:hypothetical protein [Ruminococcus sp.]
MEKNPFMLVKNGLKKWGAVSLTALDPIWQWDLMKQSVLSASGKGYKKNEKF